MAFNIISHRPTVISAFRGCLLGQAAAAYQATRHDVTQTKTGHWTWPHELFYTHFLVKGYISTGGRLDLAEMKKSIELGLEIEKGDQRLLTDLFCDGESAFHELTDRQRRTKIKRIVPRNQIGGPGFAAHASAIGLVNRSHVGRLFDDSYKIGRISHKGFECALAGGMVTALTIAYAVTEGDRPDVVFSRLMTTLKSGLLPHSVPAVLMRRLDLVESLIKNRGRTEEQILELRCAPHKTVLDVLPGALFAALNGARTFGGLLRPLKVFDNYKSGMIAASIWGAMHGVEAIAENYLREMEDITCIEDNAKALYEATLTSV